MSKKALYYEQAKTMFVLENRSCEDIAQRLRLGEKTVRNWKSDGGWDEQRKKHMATVTSLSADLEVFVHKLVKSLIQDLENERPTDGARMYTLGRLCPQLTSLKKFDELKAKLSLGDETKPKSLSAEAAEDIKQALGLI